MRGATLINVAFFGERDISIHAPHAGCDAPLRRWCKRGTYFNPRTPCGVRQIIFVQGVPQFAISIHAPHAGCDAKITLRRVTIPISIHAPHAGCDKF